MTTANPELVSELRDKAFTGQTRRMILDALPSGVVDKIRRAATEVDDTGQLHMLAMWEKGKGETT